MSVRATTSAHYRSSNYMRICALLLIQRNPPFTFCVLVMILLLRRCVAHRGWKCKYISKPEEACHMRQFDGGQLFSHWTIGPYCIHMMKWWHTNDQQHVCVTVSVKVLLHASKTMEFLGINYLNWIQSFLWKRLPIGSSPLHSCLWNGRKESMRIFIFSHLQKSGASNRHGTWRHHRHPAAPGCLTLPHL